MHHICSGRALLLDHNPYTPLMSDWDCKVCCTWYNGMSWSSLGKHACSRHSSRSKVSRVLELEYNSCIAWPFLRLIITNVWGWVDQVLSQLSQAVLVILSLTVHVSCTNPRRLTLLLFYFIRLLFGLDLLLTLRFYVFWVLSPILLHVLLVFKFGLTKFLLVLLLRFCVKLVPLLSELFWHFCKGDACITPGLLGWDYIRAGFRSRWNIM